LLRRRPAGERGQPARLLRLLRRQPHLPEHAQPARGGRGGGGGPGADRDRQPLPGAAIGTRKAEPARKRHGRGSRARGDPRREPRSDGCPHRRFGARGVPPPPLKLGPSPISTAERAFAREVALEVEALLGSAGSRLRGAARVGGTTPRRDPRDGVDMWMKVRRGGISALVILTGASLLQTSTSFAGRNAGRTLNLRVPGGGFPGARGSVGAWVVGGVKGQMLRAAHAVAGEGPAEGGPSKAGQLVVVKLTVGRRRAETVL